MTKRDLDPKTQKIVDDFDAHAKKRFTELLGHRENAPLQATAEVSFCLGYKAGVVDFGAAQREEAVIDVAAFTSRGQRHWVVSARYAAAGPRPGNRRHPAPEDFCRRTVVGPAAPATVEAVLDLLAVSEDVRIKIRANSVVRDFVEDKLVPDQAYPHNALGMHYVSADPDAQLVEWDLCFAFVSQFVVQETGGAS